MTSDLLHLQPLEGSRNVVLSDVVRWGLLGNSVEHNHTVSAPPVGIGHVPAVVGVGTGCAALDGHTPTSVRTRQAGREIQSVLRLSLGKILVDLLQVVKRTNTPLIP